MITTWHNVLFTVACATWAAFIGRVALHHARKQQWGQMMVALVILAPHAGYVLLTLTAAIYGRRGA